MPHERMKRDQVQWIKEAEAEGEQDDSPASTVQLSFVWTVQFPAQADASAEAQKTMLKLSLSSEIKPHFEPEWNYSFSFKRKIKITW